MTDSIASANEYLVRNCTIAYQCNTKWENLTDDGIEGVRFCEKCEKEVHLCVSDAEVIDSIRRNLCIAVEIAKSNKSQWFMGSVQSK
jgi:hypothetical protein